jgi:hypothetical protein
LKSAEQRAVEAAVAVTAPAASVGPSAATLNGTVLGETTTTAYFQYGTSTGYGASTAHQSVPASINPRAVSAPVIGLSPGTTYHFRIVAENAGGPAFGADQAFTTGPAPLIPPIICGLCALPLRPVITAARESNRVWRAGNKLARISKRKPPVGTTFSFNLNERASVRFAFTQDMSGRKLGGRCVAQTKANRGKRACRLTLTRGTLSFTGHPGTNKIAFQGRLSRSKKLPPGTYTLRIVATNAAGQRSSAAQLKFTIVK